MMAGLVEAVAAAEEDEAVRVIVIDGEGEHFCAGADIVARNAETTGPGRQHPTPGPPHGPPPRLPVLAVQVPVVCAVRGWAAGLGFQLALAADFTLAADDARSGSRSSTGASPPTAAPPGCSTRRVGRVRARDLLLLGRKLSGTEAVEWGLIHAAHPADALDAEVRRSSNGWPAGRPWPSG